MPVSRGLPCPVPQLCWIIALLLPLELTWTTNWSEPQRYERGSATNATQRTVQFARVASALSRTNSVAQVLEVDGCAEPPFPGGASRLSAICRRRDQPALGATGGGVGLVPVQRPSRHRLRQLPRQPRLRTAQVKTLQRACRRQDHHRPFLSTAQDVPHQYSRHLQLLPGHEVVALIVKNSMRWRCTLPQLEHLVRLHRTRQAACMPCRPQHQWRLAPPCRLCPVTPHLALLPCQAQLHQWPRLCPGPRLLCLPSQWQLRLLLLRCSTINSSPRPEHQPSRLHRKPDLLLRPRPRLWPLLRCRAGRSPSISSLISRLFCSCCNNAVRNRTAACVKSFFRSWEKLNQEGEGVLLDTGELVSSQHCPSTSPCAEAVPIVLPLAQLRAGSRLFTRLFMLWSFPSCLTCRCAGSARPWWELESTPVRFSVEHLLLDRLSQFANTCLPTSCPTCADLFTVEPAYDSPAGFLSSCALGLPWLPVHPASLLEHGQPLPLKLDVSTLGSTLPSLDHLARGLNMRRQATDDDETVEVAVDPESDDERIPDRLNLGLLAAGTEAAKVVAGHRPELVGVRVLILPSTDHSSRNVRPLQGSREQKLRTYTVDIQHLQACAGLVADQDDGLHPSLRWRLHPPPLTLLSARWLLGWASYDTLVPPAAPKRDGRGHLLAPTLEMDLPEPWTGHQDPDTSRTFYYNRVTKDATWRRPSEPQRLPLDVDLPAPWEAHRAQGTDWTFYYNKITGESTWQYPQTALASQELGELEPTADSSYPEDPPGTDPGHLADDCPVSTPTAGAGAIVLQHRD